MSILGAGTANKSTINGNGAHDGGGIYNNGILSINNSTISQNTAGIICLSYFHNCISGYGGGISSSGGAVTITNSTITDNSATGSNGGGISGSTGGTVRINNSTISQNTATEVCAFGHCYGGSGGGIWSAVSTTLQNSIVANSPSGGDCNSGTTSNGYNLSSDNTCNFNGPGDMNNLNPMLGTLGNYGGPTQTIPLLAGSPAIDAGNPSGCTDGQGHLLKTDQRGKPRPDPEDTGGCDMGAYENQSD